MALFLSILKIIGIVLLVILAVLLAVFLLVMFVPIRYYVEGRVDETDLETEKDKLKERIYLKAGFSWLLHFVRGYIEFPEEMQFTVKILFFQLLPGKSKKSEVSDEELDSENSDESTTDEESESDSDKTDINESTADNSEASANEEPKSEETDADTLQNDHKNGSNGASDNADINSDDDLESGEDEKSFFDVLEDIWNRFVEILKVPQNVFAKIQCTISSIYAKIDMVKKTLENDILKRAFEVTKKQVIKVVKMLLPRKCKADILIGMSDPTVTADIFAAYGVLYPILVKKVYLRPDFERSVIEGELHIKGRVRVITIVIAAAILFFNKDVRKTVRRFKKILKS